MLSRIASSAAQHARALVLLALATAPLGCAGSSEYMGEVPRTAPIGAAADTATLVFVRPSGVGFAINFTILDQNGAWLGEAVAKSHFAVSVPPGRYFIVGWSENSAPLEATVAPGRVYYVEVVPKLGALAARVALEALSPRHEDWRELGAWLRDTHRLAPLPTGRQAFEARRAEALDHVKSARENWADLSAADRERATLHPEDGVPSSPGLAAR